jgi:hypothetical protein
LEWSIESEWRPGGREALSENQLCPRANLWLVSPTGNGWESSMAGLKDKRGFIDKDRLDLSERQAVEYWMKRWGVTRDQLTAAHRKAGRMVKDIAAELGKKR